jgi:RNA polymerase sigma-70 factor, ECF subfamily
MSVNTALREPTDGHSVVHLPKQATPTKADQLPADQPPTDQIPAIVAQARAGDAAAFGQIYAQYFDTIYRFVQFRVGNRQTAEDITADTFVRALRRIDTFTWQGRDIGAWLVTIARNLVADHFKSRRVRYEITTVDPLDGDAPHVEQRAADDTEKNVIDYLTHVDMLRAVSQLSPDQQECIVLRFLHGLSVAETARIMGRNEGAIKALQFRARNVLARMLTDDDLGDGGGPAHRNERSANERSGNDRSLVRRSGNRRA